MMMMILMMLLLMLLIRILLAVCEIVTLMTRKALLIDVKGIH